MEKPNLKLIVAASAAGTAFEWYDFFIFGTLTSIIGKNFFSSLPEATATLFALLTFGLGFVARPIGALVFGHIGDRKGRKGTFLYTILIMGLATILIGFLPTFAMAGIISPILLLSMRVIQGFALGGEYGGAAIYVAEHSPARLRGKYTGGVQTSAAIGLMAALGIIWVTRTLTGEPQFADWGWRIPFIVSTGLLVVSVIIRTKTAESPSFKALYEEKALTKAPFKDSFGQWKNLKKVIIALFSMLTAQGVIWYTSFFYTQVYLEKTVKLDPALITDLIFGMTLITAPLYWSFAALSDRFGRKPIMLAGMLLATISFIPGFNLMLKLANPDLDQAMKATPIMISADPKSCHFQFNPVGNAQFSSACDVAKGLVTNLGLPYQSRDITTPVAAIDMGATHLDIASLDHLKAGDAKALKAKDLASLKAALKAAHYPDKADTKKANLWGVLGVLVLFGVACTALYGPMASALVEMFETKVRYTALSLPYNIGTGWFGGLLPAISFAMVAASGNIYFGLWYPVGIGILACIVTVLCLKETSGRDLDNITD